MVSVWAERSEYVATRQVLTQNVTWAGARMRRESANLRYGQLTGWAAPATAGDLVTGLFHFHVQIWDHDHQCIGLT
jgi:hypothetical protein